MCRCCLCCVAWFSYWFDNLGFITEGNTYHRCVVSSLPLWRNTDVVQAASKGISGAVAGEIYAQVKTYQVPITNPYLPHYIICHLPFVFLSPLHPCRFIRPLFSVCLFLPVSCLLVCWIACLSRWLYLDLVIFTLKVRRD